MFQDVFIDVDVDSIWLCARYIHVLPRCCGVAERLRLSKVSAVRLTQCSYWSKAALAPPCFIRSHNPKLESVRVTTTCSVGFTCTVVVRMDIEQVHRMSPLHVTCSPHPSDLAPRWSADSSETLFCSNGSRSTPFSQVFLRGHHQLLSVCDFSSGLAACNACCRARPSALFRCFLASAFSQSGFEGPFVEVQLG